MTRARRRNKLQGVLPNLRPRWQDAPGGTPPRHRPPWQSARNILAQAQCRVFEATTPEYAYLTRDPFPVMRDGAYLRRPARFLVSERVVNVATGALAVRVWLTPAQITRLAATVAAPHRRYEN